MQATDVHKRQVIKILIIFAAISDVSAVQPICLPDPSQDYDNVTAVVTDILQEATVVRTMSTEQCREKYGEGTISSAMICVEEEARDSCIGDIGGPLAVLGPDNSYSQIGVGLVSLSQMPCPSRYPGVYARVTSFLTWMQDRMDLPTEVT